MSASPVAGGPSHALRLIGVCMGSDRHAWLLAAKAHTPVPVRRLKARDDGWLLIHAFSLPNKVAR